MKLRKLRQVTLDKNIIVKCPVEEGREGKICLKNLVSRGTIANLIFKYTHCNIISPVIMFTDPFLLV